MPDRQSLPWLLSLGLHLLLGSFLLVLVSQPGRPGPGPIRMRLASPPAPAAGPGLSHGPSGAWWTEPGAPAVPGEPAAPGWQEPAAVVPEIREPVPVPASLGDLLAGTEAQDSPEPVLVGPEVSPGWSLASGTGYVPPPLPPPQWVPPGGARWTLSITVPGAGGLATAVDGVDSGHPDLDAWLGNYLRTVSFPPAPDGRDYPLRWVLTLDSGKPR